MWMKFHLVMRLCMKRIIQDQGQNLELRHELRHAISKTHHLQQLIVYVH